MLGKSVIFGAFLGWQYTGHEQIKQAFILSLLVGIIRFAIKFTEHRRQWAKFVLAHRSQTNLARPTTFVLLGPPQVLW
jgi:hypothetical protein